MRFRPTSLKPHPVERPEHHIVLPPGSSGIKRGKRAKRGPVAWNQPSDGSPEEFGLYNTVRPFFETTGYVFWWRKISRDPDAYERGTALVEWMRLMEDKEHRDWRLVQREMVDQLGVVAKDFYEYAKWHMTGGLEGKQPVGANKPFYIKAQGLMTAAGELTRCITICRLRIEQSETAVSRRKTESEQLSAAIDAVAAKAEMAEWDKKVATSA